MDLVAGSVESISLAIEKLVLLLTEVGEQNSTTGVNRIEVVDLRTELEILRMLLKDREANSDEQELSEEVKAWLSQIKEVAELIEHVMADYILKASQRSRQRGFINFVGKAGRLMGVLNSRPNLASNIQNIRALLLEIKEKSQAHGLGECESSHRRSTRNIVGRYQPRFVSNFRNENVDVDSDKKELLEKLLVGSSRRSVISLVGSGGIGKTYLARKVYDSDVVRQHFDYNVWIPMNQSFDIKYLLIDMVKAICRVKLSHNEAVIHTMEMPEIISFTREFWHSKRYVLVLDNVWQVELWQFMKHVFPDDNNGSRIIITTRSNAVGDSCKESSFDHVIKLKPFSEAMSRDLFNKIVFPREPEHCRPPELEQLSREFIKMCEGLPLAIKAIALLLSRKKVIVSEWQRLLDNIYSELQHNPDLAIVYESLTRSLTNLPPHLKLCFLYFSIFPKNSLISHDKLFKLWIAEGFVQKHRRKTLEQVAEEYLNELINVNLVQACEGYHGLEKFCKVNNLVHEVARQKADEFSFCQFWDDENLSSRGKSRRLSISGGIAENVLQSIEGSQVHSVFLFDTSALDNSFVVTLFKENKLLTLLNFENVPLEHLPEELGSLFHLKYLSLKNTKLRLLPESVGELHNLQTLDLRNTLLVGIPNEISKLENIQHLLASGSDEKLNLDSTKGVMIKEGIGCLQNLRTLMTVDAHLSGIDVLKELNKLRHLRRLAISRLSAGVASALCSCIEEMSHLESLNLQSMNNYEILDLEAISFPPPFLQHLVLKGRLRKLPSWISSLQFLSMLCLSFSRLTDDPLKHLYKLPNLVSIWLYRAYDGRRLHFKAGGFQKLKLLVLREFHELTEVEIEYDALSLLEELRIGPSPLLNAVPFGIQHLRNLKVFANYDMPRGFVLSMQPNGGLDHWKVKHVPTVHFWYRVEGRQYMLYKLGEQGLWCHLWGLERNVKDITLDRRFSFYYSCDEDDSVSASTSNSQWNDTDRLSFSSGQLSFFSDDIED